MIERDLRWAMAGQMPSPDAIRDHLLVSLFQPVNGDPQQYARELEESGIVFTGDWFGLVTIGVVAVDAYAYLSDSSGSAYSEADLSIHILGALRTLVQENTGAYAFKAASELMCVVSRPEKDALQAALDALVSRIAVLEQQIAGIRIFINLSSPGEGVECLQEAKLETEYLQEYRALHLDCSPVLTPEVLAKTSRYPVERPDIIREQEALALFRSGHYREASRIVGSLFDQEYLPLANPLILLKHKCAQYLDALAAAGREMLGNQVSEALRLYQPELRLMQARTYPEVRAQMEHTFGQLNDLLLASGKSDTAVWVNDIKNYIRGNYTDPDLNLNKIADAFGKNPSYLSRSFLRLTGTSILDYIHRYRIQEARILIGRGETLASAAEAVGYSNVLTMSRAFKKYVGTTPGKLRG